MGWKILVSELAPARLRQVEYTYNCFPHDVFSARNQNFFACDFTVCYRLTNPAEFVYFSPRDHAVHYSSQRPCSTLFHPETMQYTIPLRDHAVHYSSQRPCSTLFLSETMQYTIPLRDYVQYTIPPRDHAVHYSCNELCNHASNI